MRLKSIKLAGFKSFVDSTVVPFPSNMTAIVGPNGCGKSNVIDAVRWVMGESSAKYLRGESMTDVIFNGSTHRQPVGKASIELLFDNSKGQLLGEFAAFNEISIKRQVTREGVSQYFLNGSKCRRRDVTDIFLGTGMGPRSYAIIEQGMISRLIESKPEELRVYLEEAAGISKYKERRRETENRMRRTQENLERLNDIREELAKQLATLKRQASAAQRFGEYKAEQRKTEAKLAALNWRELSESLNQRSEQCKAIELEVEKSVLSKTTGQASIEAARAELEESIEGFQQLQAKYYQSGAEIAKYEQELKFERERSERAAEEKLRITDSIRRSEERVNLLREELGDRGSELEEMVPELELLLEQQEAHLERVDGAEARFQEWLLSNESLQEKHAQARSNADAKQGAVTQLEGRIQQSNERLVVLKQERDQIDAQNQTFDESGHAQRLIDLEEQMQIERARVEEAGDKSRDTKVVLNETRQQFDLLKSEIASDNAVLSSLKTIQAEALQQGESGESRFVNTADRMQLDRVIDRIQIDAAWSSVVEALLGDILQGFVLNEPQFRELDFSEFESESFAALLTRSTVSPITAGSLAGKVKNCPPLNAFLNVFKCVDTLDNALEMREGLSEEVTLVTPDGFIVTASSVRHLRLSDQDDGLVVRQTKIDELGVVLESKGDRVRELEQALIELEQQLESCESLVADGRSRLDELNKSYAQLSAQASALKARGEQLAERKKRNEEQMRELAVSLEEDRARVDEARDEWQSAMDTLDAMSDERTMHSGQRDLLREEIEHARDAQRDVQSKVHALTLAKQKASDRIALLQQTEAEQAKSLASMNASLSVLADEQSDLEKIELLQGKLQDELVAHEREEKKLVVAREAQEALQARLRDLEVARERVESTLSDLRGKLEAERLQMQALEMERAQQNKVIADNDHELEPLLEELLAEPMVREELDQNLERLASRIQRLGPINLAAVDEYEAQSERKNYLDMQNEELVEALSTLESAIRKIDKETRARFKDTYDRVNSGLQDLFPKIFGGGSARLELTDSDLLETGVTIMAKPPGKNNSTINLLSGGEKALTALALIFSIFKLNPAPFCMLDEVDAPLDDANVGRFARLVKEMSATVQFIYISHNKVSMEMADQLMGVTMHEPGVSRLVSVDIDAAAQLVQA